VLDPIAIRMEIVFFSLLVARMLSKSIVTLSKDVEYPVSGPNPDPTLPSLTAAESKLYLNPPSTVSFYFLCGRTVQGGVVSPTHRT